jgi:signal transduction histidine kinase
MRLADFIRSDMSAILAKWEDFAATCEPAASSMGPRELRDHAQQILEAVALDLSTPQSAEEQALKSVGLARDKSPFQQTAAQTHAVIRAKSGYDIKQLVAEYRALRASVISLWTDVCQPTTYHLQDVIRFNESIDQAIAESVGHFSAQVDQGRNILLGMLSHDMCTPLQTVRLTARQLVRLNAGTEVAVAAGVLTRSSAHLQALLDDLVDFNRANLGLGVEITPVDVDLAALCAQQIEQLSVGFPDTPMQLHVEGDAHGYWDPTRLRQVLGNLVTNAIHHGAPDQPIRVRVLGEVAGVRLDVSNSGPAIAAELLPLIFDPLQRNKSDGHSGLGLGLYIVREIARGHGGSVDARSSSSETVFSVLLPRRSAQTP